MKAQMPIKLSSLPGRHVETVGKIKEVTILESNIQIQVKEQEQKMVAQSRFVLMCSPLKLFLISSILFLSLNIILAWLKLNSVK